MPNDDLLDNKEDFGKMFELCRKYSPESIAEAITHATDKQYSIIVINKIVKLISDVDSYR